MAQFKLRISAKEHLFQRDTIDREETSHRRRSEDNRLTTWSSTCWFAPLKENLPDVAPGCGSFSIKTTHPVVSGTWALHSSAFSCLTSAWDSQDWLWKWLLLDIRRLCTYHFMCKMQIYQRDHWVYPRSYGILPTNSVLIVIADKMTGTLHQGLYAVCGNRGNCTKHLQGLEKD